MKGSRVEKKKEEKNTWNIGRNPFPTKDGPSIVMETSVWHSSMNALGLFFGFEIAEKYYHISR